MRREIRREPLKLIVNRVLLLFHLFGWLAGIEFFMSPSGRMPGLNSPPLKFLIERIARAEHFENARGTPQLSSVFGYRGHKPQLLREFNCDFSARPFGSVP